MFVFVCSSEHLCPSELNAHQTSIGSGEKIVSDHLQARQTTFSRDQHQAESESDPDRDIELELRALDMEDSENHEIKSQVKMSTLSDKFSRLAYPGTTLPRHGSPTKLLSSLVQLKSTARSNEESMAIYENSCSHKLSIQSNGA